MPTFRAALATLSLACITSAVCGYLPAVSQAMETAKLDVTFSPNRLGAETTINMHLRIGTTDGGVPSPVTSFDMRMPPSLELLASTLGLAICDPAKLLAEGLDGCSPNARLGSGSATVEVPFGPEVSSESATIEALMGPPQDELIGVLLFAESRTPVFAQLVFPGTILIDANTNSETLNTSIPPTPTLPGAADVSTTDLRLSVGPNHLTYYKKVHGRQVGYRPRGAELPRVCPRGGLRFTGDLRFESGTTLTVSYTVPCPPGRHRHH